MAEPTSDPRKTLKAIKMFAKRRQWMVTDNMETITVISNLGHRQIEISPEADGRVLRRTVAMTEAQFYISKYPEGQPVEQISYIFPQDGVLTNIDGEEIHYEKNGLEQLREKIVFWKHRDNES